MRQSYRFFLCTNRRINSIISLQCANLFISFKYVWGIQCLGGDDMLFILSFTEIIKILIPVIGQHLQLVNLVPNNEIVVHQNPKEQPATRHNDWRWLYVTLKACWHAAISREVWVTAPSLLIYHPRLLHVQLKNTRRQCTGAFTSSVIFFRFI
jgi:hypothetical protein